MKITKQNKHRNKKLALLVSAVALILLIAAAVYLVFFNGKLLGWQPFPPTATPAPTTQSSDDTDHGTKDDTTPGTDKTTDQIPVSETLVATFTDLSQSGGYIKFSGTANDDKTGGSCSIVFTNPNDRPVSRTSQATQNGGKAVCGPIQIPETEFSFLGEWTATFRYYTDDSQAVVERKITIQ